MVTRGIRNNNPANIRRGASWKGLRRYQTDFFCQFENMSFGIRAFFVLMRTYHYRYNLNTISEILYRFAPLSENNTFAYISAVTSSMNKTLGSEYQIDEHTRVNVWLNPKTPSRFLREFAKNVFWIESKYVVDDDDLMKAISLI